MNCISFVIIPLASALCLASCATIPKESIELSASLNREISLLKSANAALIDSVYSAKERDVIDYLDNDWYPAYVRNMFKPKLCRQCGVGLWSQMTQTRVWM